MALKGKLGTAQLADVFQMLKRGKSTGILRIQTESGERLIEFTDGSITTVSDASHAPDLGGLLQAHGLIDDIRLTVAEVYQRKHSMTLGNALIQQEVVTLDQLNGILKFQLQEEICDLLLLKDADFDFEPDEQFHPTSRMDGGLTQLSIDPDTLLLEAARRTDEWQSIQDKIPSPSCLFTVTAHGRKYVVSAPPQHRRIIELIDRKFIFDSIVDRSLLGRFQTGQMIAQLMDASVLIEMNFDLYPDIAQEHLDADRPDEAMRIFAYSLKYRQNPKRKSSIMMGLGKAEALIAALKEKEQAELAEVEEPQEPEKEEPEPAPPIQQEVESAQSPAIQPKAEVVSDNDDGDPEIKIGKYIGPHRGSSGSDYGVHLDTLKRHTVILGGTGSGKTVLAKVMLEEALMAGVPCIAVDLQGDIISMLKSLTARQAKAEGADAEALKRWKENVEVVVWTPAGQSGVPMAIHPFSIDLEGLSKEERIRTVSGLANNTAAILGYDTEHDNGRYVESYLTPLLDWALEDDRLTDLGGLIPAIDEMPEYVREQTSGLLNDRELEKLKKNIKITGIGTRQLMFNLGKGLDIDVLLGRDASRFSGKTRLSVIYLGYLREESERAFFISVLAGALARWMYHHPPDELQALFFLDEAAPFVPPVRKPICKDELMTLFRQARKYGLGIICATQSPGDIDYKAFGQFGSWYLGRLTQRQDIKKLKAGLQAKSEKIADEAEHALPALSPGEFIAITPDTGAEPVKIASRRLLTVHQTWDEDSLAKNYPKSQRNKIANTPALRRLPSNRAPARQEPTQAPEKKASKKAVIPETPVEYVEKQVDKKPDKESEKKAEKKAEAKVETAPPVPDKYDGYDPDLDKLQSGIATSFVELQRAWSVKEILQTFQEGRTDFPEEVAQMSSRELSDKLNELVELDRLVHGARGMYWWKAFKYLPDHKILKHCPIAQLEYPESRIMPLARKKLKTHLIRASEEISGCKLNYLPIYRVTISREERKGIIFKKTVEVESLLYFDALQVYTATYSKKHGVQFEAVVEADPMSIATLSEDIFEPGDPGQLTIVPGMLDERKSAKQIRNSVASKYGITPVASDLCFYPFWIFDVDLKGERVRRFLLDGVTGKEFTYPGGEEDEGKEE